VRGIRILLCLLLAGWPAGTGRAEQIVSTLTGFLETPGDFVPPDDGEDQQNQDRNAVGRRAALLDLFQPPLPEGEGGPLFDLPDYDDTIPESGPFQTLWTFTNDTGAPLELNLSIRLRLPPGTLPPALQHLDVSGDGAISPIDALQVINHLNQAGGGPAPQGSRLDVNRDGSISPIDALQVINYLNAAPGGDPLPSFTRTVTVPAGGGPIVFDIPASDPAWAALERGDYLVDFVASDSDGEALARYDNNPLTIESDIALIGVTYSSTVNTETGPLDFSFRLQNASSAGRQVVLSAILTPLTQGQGEDPVEPMVFSRQVEARSTGSGQSQVDLLRVTGGELAAAGAPAGDYRVDFRVENAGDGSLEREMLDNDLLLQMGRLEVNTPPAFDPSIGVNDPLEVTIDIQNSGNVPAEDALFSAIIRPVGDPEAAPVILSTPLASVPLAGESFTIQLDGLERLAEGLVPGDYLVDFILTDQFGGERAAYRDQALTIEPGALVFLDRPVYSADTGDAIRSRWTLGHAGATPEDFDLKIVVTPAAGGTSWEFPFPTQLIPGIQSVELTVLPSELAAAGITPGDYTVDFVGLDPDGMIVNQFVGEPLHIGMGAAGFVGVEFDASPAVLDSEPQAEFPFSWVIENTGDATVHLRLQVTLTPEGAGPEAARLIQDRWLAIPPPPSDEFQFVAFGQLVSGELTEQGIPFGLYTVDFEVLDAEGDSLGIASDVPLVFGVSLPALSEVTSYTDQLSPSGGGRFTSQWAVENQGAGSPIILPVLGFTPVDGGPEDRFEVERRAFAVPNGSRTITVDASISQLTNGGVVPGRYQLDFVAYEIDLDSGERLREVGRSENHPFTFGTIALSFDDQPAVPASVAAGEDFTADFSVGNGGDAPDGAVTLKLVFTPEGGGSDRTATQTVSVSPGGGLFSFRLDPAARSALGLTAGRYQVDFFVLDAFDRMIGDGFFDALVEFLSG